MVSPITVTTVLNPNQEMTDFDYKKYSLENLENWINDAIYSDDVTPQEIYDTIVKVVRENHEYHTIQASRVNELLTLLNANENQSSKYQGVWNDFWESNNTVELPPNQSYIGWQTMSDYKFNQEFPPRKDKVVKWQLPVHIDGLTGDCYIELPDDLLEVAGLKEGDTVEWIDRGDGSFEMKKADVHN